VQLTLVCYLLTLQFSHSYLYHEDHHGGHEKEKWKQQKVSQHKHYSINVPIPGKIHVRSHLYYRS
jgi:hypothetical protein